VACDNRRMQRSVVLALVLAAGAAHAGPSIDLVAANGIDPSTGYLTDLPNSVAAGHAKVHGLASCAKLVALDYTRPSSVLVDVYLKVGGDGKVTSVDTATDPSLHVTNEHVSPAAACIAPIVKTWTFPDHDDVLLRFVLVDVAVKRAPKLADGYVASFAAVCAAAPKAKADIQARVAAIQAALAAHPDEHVQDLLTSLGGYVPATRPAVIRALAANAGIAKCPALLDM
jgi:hypothetical protein